MKADAERTLKISDFSDREILAIIRDAGGSAAASEVAIRIFAPGDDKVLLFHYTRCVTSRFVWMRRYGLLTRADDGGWEISVQGERLRAGSLSTTLESGITRLSEDNSLALANTVGEKLVYAGEIAGRAMQRELAHQVNRRRARLRGW